MTAEAQVHDAEEVDETCPHCGCSHYGKNQVPACEGHKRTLERQARDDGLVGIDGWLYLPVYGGIGGTFFQTLKSIYDTAGTNPYLIEEALLVLPLVGAVGVLAALHHKWFKWAWIGVFGTLCALDLWMMAEIELPPDELWRIIGAAIAVVGWSIYLLESKRVKRTFTRSGAAVPVLVAAVAISGVVASFFYAYHLEERMITLDNGRTVYVDADAEERLRSGERVEVGEGVFLEMEDDEILYYDHGKTAEKPWESDEELKESIEDLTDEQFEELEKMLEGTEAEKPAAE